MWRLANRTPAVSSDLSLQSKERRHNELTILAYASDLPDGALMSGNQLLKQHGFNYTQQSKTNCQT
jgi:hypothetical protein